HHGMSRGIAVPSVVSRPTLFDYFLVVSGFGLSLFLSQAESLKVMPAEAATSAATSLILILPKLVRLPEGVILLWPIFYAAQRVLGRKQAITSGEWLWVFAWLVTALLTGLAAWQAWGTPFEFLTEHLPWVYIIGYVIVVPSMAAIALVLILLGLIGR